MRRMLNIFVLIAFLLVPTLGRTMDCSMGQQKSVSQQAQKPCMEHAHDTSSGKKKMTIAECGNFDSVTVQNLDSLKSPSLSVEKISWPLAIDTHLMSLMVAHQNLRAPPIRTSLAPPPNIIILNHRLII